MLTVRIRGKLALAVEIRCIEARRTKINSPGHRTKQPAQSLQ